MKIIAITQTGYSPRYLADISEEELKCCMGDRYASLSANFKIGDTVDVVSGWDRVTALNRAQEKLTSAKATLRGILELLEPINPLQTIDAQPIQHQP